VCIACEWSAGNPHHSTTAASLHSHFAAFASLLRLPASRVTSACFARGLRLSPLIALSQRAVSVVEVGVHRWCCVMGACNSSPEADSSPDTNSSPAFAPTTHVKEKKTPRGSQEQKGDDDAALLLRPSKDARLALDDDGAAEDGNDGDVSGMDGETQCAMNGAGKEKEETKENNGGAAELRPTSASQKLSGRDITPRTAQTATTSVTAATTSETAEASLWSGKPLVGSTDSESFSSSSASSSSDRDVEFKKTVRSVLILLLDRLTRTMEYEKAAFQELAVAVGLSNYMNLFDYSAFESFFRDNFSIPPSPAPHQQDDDLRFLSQYFALFLTMASNASAAQTSRVFPTRVQLTISLQRLCSETSGQLLKWCASPAATVEVLEHLRFFAQALEFAKGDLVNNPQLLYKNIDEICD
jgi:hypothetical protein